MLGKEKTMEAYVLLHPTRFKIVELLAEKPMYIAEIAKTLRADSQFVISYHLRILEEYGFLSGRYEISKQPKSRGKAVKIFSVTGKVEQVKRVMKEKL